MFNILLVNSICFAPHAYGLNLACASSDGNVSLIYQIGEEWQTKTISAHSSGCNSVSWCPSSVPSSLLALDFNALDKQPVPLGPKRIATGGCDNTVKLWKAVIVEEGNDGVVNENWELESTLNDHTDWVRDVCWRPNLGQVDHLLVSCSQDNSVLIWRFNEEEKKWKSRKLKSTPFPDTLWRVSFSEYGHLLAVSCGDNTVTLWKENAETGAWELVGNVDETVSETVKIEEPLAVAPPPSAPIPQIDFNSAPKIASDVGYMKPLSPMMPTPSIPQSIMSPGYNQIDQDYDNFQNAQVPTIPLPEQSIFQSNVLAQPVIPEQEQVQELAQELSNIEFNKDIGFTGANVNHNQIEAEAETVNSFDQLQYDSFEYQQQPQYEQYDTTEETSYDQNYYEQNASSYQQYEQAQTEYEQHESYEQQTFEQPSYEHPSYEQQSYEQPTYEQAANKEQSYEHPVYGEQSYEKTTYDPNSYEQPVYNQSAYESSSYEQAPVTYENSYEQASYENNNSYEPPVYDNSAYEQVSYEQSSFEPSYSYDLPPNEEPKEQATDYTLQYEGYQSAPITNNNDAVNF